MMNKTFVDTRQIWSKQSIDEISLMPKTQLDHLLTSVSEELQVPFRLHLPSLSSYTVNIGPAAIQNTITNKTHVAQPIDKKISSFLGSTITIPAASGSNIINSAGPSVLLTISNNNFIKCLIQINSLGVVTLKLGVQGFAESTASLPTTDNNCYPIGYITIHAVGSVVQHISTSAIYQFVGPQIKNLGAALNYIGATGAILGTASEQLGGSNSSIYSSGAFTGVTTDYYVRFTSGFNKGQSRKISSVVNVDQVNLSSVLPYYIAVGDSFEMYIPDESQINPVYKSHQRFKDGVDLTSSVGALDNDLASILNLCEVSINDNYINPYSIDIKPSRYKDYSGKIHYTWVVQDKASVFPSTIVGDYNGGINNDAITNIAFSISGGNLMAVISGADQLSTSINTVGTIDPTDGNYTPVTIYLDKYNKLGFSFIGVSYASLSDCFKEANIPPVSGKKLSLACIALQKNGANFNIITSDNIIDRRTIFGITGKTDNYYEEHIGVTTAISKGDTISLPLDSRNSNAIKYYENGAGELEFFVNGVKELATQAKISIVGTPNSYSSITGILSLPDSFDLSLVSIGDFFVDSTGAIFPILGNIINTLGSKQVRLNTGLTISLSFGAYFMRQSYIESGSLGSTQNQITSLMDIPAGTILTFRMAN